MRHKIVGRRFGMRAPCRKSMFVNMFISLLNIGILRTTLPRAKELRRLYEPLITLGKDNSLSAYRRLLSSMKNNKIAVDRLVNVVSIASMKRNGGYLRIIKNNYRVSDGAPLAIIEFVDRKEWKSFNR